MSTKSAEIEKRFEIHLKEHSGELGLLLNRARKEKRFCDFLIKVGTEEIPIHKIVISEVSGYFRAMFTLRMKESESGVVEMMDTDPYCMCICIEYIYTGKVSVPESKIQELLKVADMLQLPKLCAEIGKFLQRNLDANTFFLTREIATTHSLQDLVKSCDEYAKENFALIAENEEFKNLEANVIVQLIGSKDIKASEAEKCAGLLLWASSDPDNRSKIFEDVFLTFNFEEIPKSYKRDIANNEPLVRRSTECLLQLYNDETEVSAQKLEKREEVIGVIDQKSKTIQTFKASDKSWNVLHTITDEISKKDFCAIAVDQVIFVLATDGTNFKFNVVKPTEGWVELPKRSEDGDVQAVELGGQVYVFRNRNTNDTLIQILNTDHTSWRKMRKPSPCCSEAITAAKGCIYIFGGYAGSYLRRSMKFDPTINSWMNLPDMPTARSRAAASEVDDKIYVAGGGDGNVLKTTECFELVTQTWTTLKPMNNPHFYFNACVLDGKVYAMGSRYHRFIIEEYDPSTDTWKDVTTVSDKNIPSKGTFTLHL